MGSGSRERIVEVFDALDAELDRLDEVSFEVLTTPERLRSLERLECLVRRLPAVGHALINQLDAQASEEELGGTLCCALANRLRITKPDAARRIADAADLGPRRALTGEPLAPQLTATATAQRQGLIGEAHVKVIRALFRPPARRGGCVHPPGRRSRPGRQSRSMDALAAHRRAHGLPAISLGWGLWDQASAMTGGLATVDFKRFARDGIVAMSSADALQLFDTAMIVDEPFMLPAHIDFAALKVKFDGGTLPPMFVDLINAPTRRQVDDSLAAAKSKSALLQRLEGLPEDEQHAVLLDLVRSHIATVLGSASPEAIDPDRAFQELGFDSLTAVEMRNRLKSATGLALSPTLIFDYPNSAALAGYMRRELLGSSPQDTSAVAAGEAELQRIVASIPVKRLRQAGVLDLLLALANETETSGQDPALAPTAEQEIADMDLDDLVNAAFRNDDE